MQWESAFISLPQELPQTGGAWLGKMGATPGALNKKYRDKDPSANKLPEHRMSVIGLDGRKHRRNLNILVCGGSGAGKTRFFCKPNAMQCNTSS